MDPIVTGGILKGAIEAGKKILDIVDPSERQKAWQEHELALRKVENDLLTGQMEVNKVEAQHDSIFVAGGRPSLIWVCSAGLALAYPVSMAIQLLIYVYLIAWMGELDTEAPRFNVAELTTLAGGMMGLSYIRSTEKKEGVAREGWSPRRKTVGRAKAYFSKFRGGRRRG